MTSTTKQALRQQPARTLAVLFAAALVVGVAGCAPSRPAGQKSAPSARGPGRVVPGLVAVDWKDGTSKERIDAEERRFGIDLEYAGPGSAAAAVTVASGVGVTDELLSRLRADPLVEAAEPVYEYEAFFVPNDPDYKLQWHLQQLGAERAWEWSTGEDVVVAVIDTGVSKLPDFANTRFVPGWDWIHDREQADDDHGHGSHVAGTIAQTTHNGTGVAGLAHRAAIMPLKVLDASGRGNTVDIADAIRRAVDKGAKVINLSLGGPDPSAVLADAVRDAHAAGVVVVCAAGNGFGPPVGFPAAFPGALAVSSVRFDRQLAPYSSFGPEVDLAGPGGDKSVDQNGDGQPDGVLQQIPGPKLAWFQGTSMASPHVAGAAALLASAGVTRGAAIEAVLRDTATDLKDAQRFGAGEVDAGAALTHVRLKGGLWRLAIAALLAWAALRLVRRRDGRVGALGFLGVLVLAWAASGLFVLPLARVGHSVPGALLATPLPEWGRLIHGASATSPLWASALLPFLLLGLARARVLAGVAAGLCLGWAAWLLHAAGAGWVDVAWVPGRLLEAAWLAGNAFLAFVFGMLALRER